MEVFDSNAKPYGLSYSDWAIRWWQWAYSIPKKNNPAIDESGKNCMQRQQGPVWFLAGTVVTLTVVRKCTIPVGKAILFPILNSEQSTAGLQGATDTELRECVINDINQTTYLDLSVDGVRMQVFDRYRILTPPFKVAICDDNFLQQKSGTARMISDGFWIILKPMPVGQHDIRFTGTDSTLDMDVTYSVIVQGFSNLDEVITIALEEMKNCLPEVTQNVNVTIDESNIESIEKVLRAAIPTLGMENVLHEDKVDIELLKDNIREILYLAAKRARSDRRKEMISSDLTNTILEINVSRVMPWPFCPC